MNSPTSTSNTIYGHVHIPKTGGSNLNGLMAAKYDNVCGNKMALPRLAKILILCH